MSITFYHSPMSTSSITEAVIAELALSAETILVDIDAGDTQTESFLKINPNGRVPVVIHEGVTITESAAITLYLGERFGVDKNLFPALGPLRAEAMTWTVWANVNLANAAGKLAAELPPDTPGAVQQGSQDFVAMELRRPADLTKAKAGITSCFNILNAGLENKDYLLGDYSLVDTHMFVLVAWAMFMELDLSEFKNVMMWFERCCQRPVLAAMMEE
ncbi:glutathione S-transferase family protein [Glaciecola sp. MH2013]|uniref:glutathione S-transferase family protein n=1 Tax=Glaciecola sp. MH2013 TaxID=2785524 RepID=UPI00189FD4F0|nr:glutathione S-transferase family protein [Glaciecola sp. MH2013]MBF7074526.1 glutathione S-transferase family protein [Glaciecola sp. MH2013]